MLPCAEMFVGILHDDCDVIDDCINVWRHPACLHIQFHCHVCSPLHDRTQAYCLSVLPEICCTVRERTAKNRGIQPSRRLVLDTILKH
mmetsp:Transcript_141514/g.452004  ORF Transcript_141514/g.452004 Transcript_141514/m.452004 type:complete len:88 (-) Transcript_141514:36-299(-)